MRTLFFLLSVAGISLFLPGCSSLGEKDNDDDETKDWSAGRLYDSIQKILALPGSTRVFVGHDYKPSGRDQFVWETTVAEQRANNVHFGDGTSREEFVRIREERDSQLGMPKLIVPSLQINMRAGQMPEADESGGTFLKVPVNRL